MLWGRIRTVDDNLEKCLKMKCQSLTFSNCSLGSFPEPSPDLPGVIRPSNSCYLIYNYFILMFWTLPNCHIPTWHIRWPCKACHYLAICNLADSIYCLSTLGLNYGIPTLIFMRYWTLKLTSILASLPNRILYGSNATFSVLKNAVIVAFTEWLVAGYLWNIIKFEYRFCHLLYEKTFKIEMYIFSPL